MSVLDRKLRRDLASVKVALVAILMVIVVGVATFVSMASVYVNLEGARSRYYAQCRMADFWVDLKKAPLAEARRVAALPGVAEIQPRIVTQATVDLDGFARPLNGQIISLPAGPAPINGIVIARGGTFTDERLEEVIVNDAFARAHGIRPGDRVHVILNNRRQDLFVVGTALSSEFVYLLGPGSLIPDPESYGVFYVKQRFAEETLDFDGACNQIVGLLTPEARARPRRVLDEIEILLEPFGVFTTTPRSDQASHQILMGELAQLRVSAVVLPAVFLGVAVVVLNILMARLAEQQRTTVGTLKALGYTNTELMRHYASFGVLVGLAGGILGLGAGWGLAQLTIVEYRNWFEFPRLDNRFVPWVYAAGVIISAGFALLGTVRGVGAIVRLDPAEAMRARPPVVAGGVWLERFGRLWRKLGFRWQMVVRSIWRHKWRTATGMLAAMMGAALMFVTFYFVDSLDYLVAHEFEKVLRSDVDLVFKDDLDGGALLEARRLPGVERAEPLLAVPCRLYNGHLNKQSAITGVTADARLTAAATRHGAVSIPSSGLLMSRRLARLLDLAPGDEVTVVPIKGRREPHRVKVERIVDGYVGMVTYADYDWLNGLINEEDAVSMVRMTADPDRDLRRAFHLALKTLPTVQSVNDTGHARERLQTTLLDLIWYSIALLVFMAGVIFFGSILTSSLIAIVQRQREVATFLVMGFDLRSISGIFLRESLLVNVIGAALGLPLGLWLSILLISFNDRDAYRLPIVTSPGSYVLTMVFTVIFTLAAHWVVHGRLRRLDWLEALNAKE